MAAHKTGSRKRRGAAPQQASAPILTINEAAEAFPGEWIFMQVMEHDEDSWPSAGIVLAHHPRRAALVETEIATAKNPPPDARGFVTYRGPLFRTNEEWRAYLERGQAARDRGT